MTDLSLKETTWRKDIGYPYHTLRSLSLPRVQRLLGIDTSRQTTWESSDESMHVGHGQFFQGHGQFFQRYKMQSSEKEDKLVLSSPKMLEIHGPHKVVYTWDYNLIFVHKKEKHSLEDPKVYAFMVCFLRDLAKPFGLSGPFTFVERLTSEVVSKGQQLSAAECLVLNST